MLKAPQSLRRPPSAQWFRLQSQHLAAAEPSIEPLRSSCWFSWIQPFVVRLNFSSLGIFVPDHAHCLARTLPSPGIGGGSLTANRKTAAMPDSSVAINRLQSLQVTLHLTSQITLDRKLVVRDCVNNLV